MLVVEGQGYAVENAVVCCGVEGGGRYSRVACFALPAILPWLVWVGYARRSVSDWLFGSLPIRLVCPSIAALWVCQRSLSVCGAA